MTNYFSKPPSDEHDLKAWLFWVVLLFAGLVVGFSFIYKDRKEQLSLSQTQVAVSSMHSQLNQLTSSALMAAHGHGDSVESMINSRNNIRNNVLILQSGGHISPSSPAPVMSLSNNPRLLSILSEIDTFDRAIQPLTSSTDRLVRISRAESRLPQVISELNQVSGQIGQSRSLSSGSWGQVLTPLRQEMTRREISNMPLIFTPSQSSSSLASQWLSLFERRAQEADALPNLASRDSNLSPQEVQLVNRFVSLVKEMASHTQTLQRYGETRVIINNAAADIEEASSSLLMASSSLVSFINNTQSSPTTKYMILFANILILIGFLGVVRAFWNMGSRYWYSWQTSRKSVDISSSVDTLTRDLKKIIGNETGDRKVSDSPSSPIFALSSLINQLITQKDNIELLLDESASNANYLIEGLENRDEQIQSSQSSSLDIMRSVHINTIHFSQNLIRLVKKLEDVGELGQNGWGVSSRGVAISQENLWKIESLRENTQSVSKRIKRLGESAQSINASIDVIKEMSKKFKVLALNIAIEAASHGEQGKNYTVLARELERLSQITDENIKDIDIQVDSIQNDSKETVSSMEENTSDVVKCTQLSINVGSVFKELEKISKKTNEDIVGIISEISEVADGIAQESVQVDVLIQSGANNQEDTQDHVIEQLKNTLSKIKSWFSGDRRGF